MLKRHPQVKTGIEDVQGEPDNEIKEVALYHHWSKFSTDYYVDDINFYQLSKVDMKYYLRNFDIKDGYVYIDGSPSIYAKTGFRNFINKLSKTFDRICFIYIYRNEKDMHRSQIAHAKLFKYRLGKLTTHKQNLEMLEFFDNLYIVRLEEIEKRQKEIYQFLGIDDSYTFKLGKENSLKELKKWKKNL
jgi:hypothetical protein